MVRVTSDWDAFKAYTEHCRIGAFQVRTTEQGTEVRVHVGKIGYIGVFEDLDKPVHKKAYEALMEFCRVRGYIEIETTVADEIFFL